MPARCQPSKPTCHRNLRSESHSRSTAASAHDRKQERRQHDGDDQRPCTSQSVGEEYEHLSVSAIPLAL
jgi:hypothetical protein